MSYNILSGSVNFEGTGQGSIEDIVNTHSDQTISGQKTINDLSGSRVHFTTMLQVGGTNATDHVVSVAGPVSASGDISGSAFYANGVLLTGGGAVTALNNRAESRLVTIGSTTTELDGEANLTFNGTVLDFKATSISGSGNISGSAFYGNWAGATILGSQVQLASAKGMQDDSGLALDVAGLSTATPAGGNTVIIDQGAGAKKCTVTNLMANAPVSDASALGNANRILLDGGVGTINTSANLTYAGSPLTLTVSGQVSASSNTFVGGTLQVDNHISASFMTLANRISHEGDEDTYISLSNNSISFTLANGQHFNMNGNNDTSTFNNSDFRINSSRPDFRVFNATGHVGVGTDTPTVPLEVSSSTTAQLKLTNTVAKAVEFTVAANGNLTISPTGSATFDSSLIVNDNTTLGNASGDVLTINGDTVTCNNGLNFDSNTLFISSSNDRVGIGSITPISKLDVSGAIAITAESTTPAQPLDGQGFIYSKNDGKLYWRSFDLTETNLSLTTADIGTTTVKTAFLSTAPTFSGGDTNEFFIKWSDGTTVNQPDLRSNNQYFLFPGGGFLSKVTAFGSTVTDSSDSNPFTNDLRIKVYVWDANDTSDIAEGNFATGYVAVASVSGSATDIKATDGGGQKRHRASYSVNINHQISASVGIAVSVQGVDAGNNNSKGFNALNLSFHFTDI